MQYPFCRLRDGKMQSRVRRSSIPSDILMIMCKEAPLVSWPEDLCGCYVANARRVRRKAAVSETSGEVAATKGRVPRLRLQPIVIEPSGPDDKQ